jgi:hypothetical protein
MKLSDTQRQILLTAAAHDALLAEPPGCRAKMPATAARRRGTRRREGQSVGLMATRD